MTLTAGQRNTLGTLNLHLSDSDGTSQVYTFDLRKLKPGATRQLVAQYGASVAEPQSVEKPGTVPGLGNIATWMIMGDWSTGAVDVVLSGMVLVPPTEALRAQRAQLRELHAREARRARQEAEAKEQARRDLLAKGAPHAADGPQVKLVCATGSDVLVDRRAGRAARQQRIAALRGPARRRDRGGSRKASPGTR